MGLGRHGPSLTGLKESLWGGKVSQHGEDMFPKGKESRLEGKWRV